MSTDRHTHADGRTHRAHDYEIPELPESVDIFDTILRDGSQQEGLSLSVDDKLRVAEQLDHLGVTFIEGGWPGANPKDVEFFARAARELHLDRATLVAFGSTRRAGVGPEDDAVLANLIGAGAPVACIVAKTWDRHVDEALRTTLDEAVAMVRDSVEYLTAHDLRVFLDAEHFFDGYRRNPDFALSVLAAAEEAGAEALVLCDTNGGSLPDEVGQAVAEVRERTSAQLGIHCHNDAGCAVANSMVAVQAGATQVQGCINGYGERAGNTDLSAAIPNLSLKLNIRTIPSERLELLTPVAHHIAELVNIPPNPQQSYVGNSVFAHKGGLHASAVARSADLYEHIEPNLVGNGTRVVVSEMAGRSTLAMKAAELGLDPREQLRGCERGRTEIEEVVCHANLWQVEDLAPDRGQAPFERSPGRNAGAADGLFSGDWKRPAVDLPARRQWEALDEDDARRDHVRRKSTTEPGTQCGGIEPGPCRNHIGDEPRLRPVAPH